MIQPEFSIGSKLAGTDFTDKQYRFVKLDSDSEFIICGAGEAGIGISQEESLTGQPLNVMVMGISDIESGGVVNSGNSLKSDAVGRAVAASETDPFIFGVALGGATAAGQLIPILLLGANMARESQSIVVLQETVPAYAQAAEGTTAFRRAPFDCTVTGVAFFANALLTGANTNSRTLKAINAGANGAGTTEIASKAFVTGVNAAALDETAITLTATVADLDVDEGELIAWNSDAVGTGLADPGGLLVITIQRR